MGTGNTLYKPYAWVVGLLLGFAMSAAATALLWHRPEPLLGGCCGLVGMLAVRAEE
jgi:uncharacterized membrane protein YccC